MKIMFGSIVTLIAISMVASAQTQTAAPAVPAAPVAVTAPATATATATAPASQTVTVTTLAAPTANVAPAPTADLAKQPTTVVEAAPLTTSHAEELRKSREQTEVETEQKIVEKLEQSRIDDEKRRQDKVLGSMSEDKKDDKKVEAAVIVAPAPAAAPVVVAPAPASAPVLLATPVAPTPAAVTPPSNELTASVADLAPEKKEENKYITSISVGMMNYNNTSEIKNFGDFGLSFGKQMDNNMTLSADFNYNSLNQNVPFVYPDGALYRSVDQYTLGTTARYSLPFGKFRPSVGAAVDYVRRQYSGFKAAGYSGTSDLGSMASNAIDYGFVAALDYQSSERMSIGLEYRYMMNMTYQYDKQDLYNLANQQYGLSTLETQNYQSWMVALRFMY